MLSDGNFKVEYWIVELDGTGFEGLFCFFLVVASLFCFPLVFDGGQKKRNCLIVAMGSKKNNEISCDQGVCIMKVSFYLRATCLRNGRVSVNITTAHIYGVVKMYLGLQGDPTGPS